MTGRSDRLVYLHDLLKGIASEEMAALLANPEIDLKELSQAVLSSTVSLQDKEMKLGFAESGDSKSFSHM